MPQFGELVEDEEGKRREADDADDAYLRHSIEDGQRHAQHARDLTIHQ